MRGELISPADVFPHCIYFIFYGFGRHATYLTLCVGIIEVMEGCLLVSVTFNDAEFRSFVAGKVYEVTFFSILDCLFVSEVIDAVALLCVV